MNDPTDVEYIRAGFKKCLASKAGNLSGRAVSLINRVIDAESISDSLSVGRFVIAQHGAIALKRLVIFREKVGDEELYVLYVPESPKPPIDQMFYEKHDWSRLCGELVSLMGPAGGLSYVLDLFSENDRNRVKAYFEEVSRLPSKWRGDVLEFASVPGATYLHQLQVIINR